MNLTIEYCMIGSSIPFFDIVLKLNIVMIDGCMLGVVDQLKLCNGVLIGIMKEEGFFQTIDRLILKGF